MSTQNNMRIVRLLNPEMCLKCRFGSLATVAGQNGVPERMIYCTRRDCDNWDTTEAEAATSVRREDGREIR